MSEKSTTGIRAELENEKYAQLLEIKEKEGATIAWQIIKAIDEYLEKRKQH